MLNFYGKSFTSRLLVGSALYRSPAIMQGAIRASGAEIVTVSLRREAAGGKTGDAFWSLIRELDVTVLPNTAGCRSVREAVTTAKLARELFATSWIKLEVIADNDTLQPDVVGLVEAADPVAMAKAFRLGVEAGRAAYEAGLMEARDFASPSTPVVGTPFWHAVS